MEQFRRSGDGSLPGTCRDEWNGALAQLGERLHGMQEVSGSIPLSSTKPPPYPDHVIPGSSDCCETAAAVTECDKGSTRTNHP